MPSGGDDVIRCSFCSRTAHEVTSMVAGPEVYICDRCIHDASGIVRGAISRPTCLRPRAGEPHGDRPAAVLDG